MPPPSHPHKIVAAADHVRHLIMEAIAAKPGIHLRDLQRVVHVSLSGIEHHVRALEREARIVTISDGYFRRCFLTTWVLPEEARRLDEEERRIIAEFRRRMSLAIVLHLAADGPLRHHELQERLGKSKGTVSYHLSRLLANGLLRMTGDSSDARYDLANRARVISLLVTFSPLFRDHVDGFVDMWLSLGARFSGETGDPDG